jgi:hypothetical protein
MQMQMQTDANGPFASETMRRTDEGIKFCDREDQKIEAQGFCWNTSCNGREPLE